MPLTSEKFKEYMFYWWIRRLMWLCDLEGHPFDGFDIDRNNLPHILYEDEDKDKVILATDSDLAAAVEHARSAGWK
ncbi:CBS domain-containing protein CBSCBSPB1, partial [Tanacetum coccineum]